MKITSKLIVLLMATLLAVGFVGCSDDDDRMPENNAGKTPEFILEQESIKVKIGSEYKVTVDVKQGGGEYDAFILDTRIAKVEVKEGEIKVEGIANGQTSLMVSDKYNRYRKLPVKVYTTDKLQLSAEEFNFITMLGSSKKVTLNVVLGNGGYEIVSDNPAVLVSINEEGEISMTATSKKAEFMANITVTDCTGLAASIAVKVIASLEAFTGEELEVIKADATRRYYFDGRSQSQPNYTFINEKNEDGKQRYGWKYYRYYCYIDFAGEKNEGVETDALYSTNSGYKNQPVQLKIIKNDGTNIWGVYSFVNDEREKLHYGYFCDTVNPE